MTIGDIIRFTPEEVLTASLPYSSAVRTTHQPDTRAIGTILKLDTYSSQVGSSFRKEPIIEVLWSDGTVGWILKSRVSKLNA